MPRCRHKVDPHVERFWFSDVNVGHRENRGYRMISENEFNDILEGKFDTASPMSWLEHINSGEGLRGGALEKEYSLKEAIETHEMENYYGAQRILSIVKLVTK